MATIWDNRQIGIKYSYIIDYFSKGHNGVLVSKANLVLDETKWGPDDSRPIAHIKFYRTKQSENSDYIFNIIACQIHDENTYMLTLQFIGLKVNDIDYNLTQLYHPDEDIIRWHYCEVKTRTIYSVNDVDIIKKILSEFNAFLTTAVDIDDTGDSISVVGNTISLADRPVKLLEHLVSK